jgi:hypothetical protein
MVVLRDGAYRVCGFPQSPDRPTGPPSCSDPLDFTPHGLGAAKEGGSGLYGVPAGTGRILVADDAAIRTYDLDGDGVVPVKTFPLAPDRGAHGTAMPYAGRLYVPVTGGVAVVDVASGRRVEKIALADTPAAIWVVPNLDVLYAALPARNAVVRVPLRGSGAGAATVVARGPKPAALAGPLPGSGAPPALYVAYAGDRSIWQLEPTLAARPTCLVRGTDAC